MRVTVILSVFVILSSVILMNAILQSYDQRTVSVRTAEIQNQCTILSNQLVNSDYLKTGVSDVIDTAPSARGAQKFPLAASARIILSSVRPGTARRM